MAWARNRAQSALKLLGWAVIISLWLDGLGMRSYLVIVGLWPAIVMMIPASQYNGMSLSSLTMASSNAIQQWPNPGTDHCLFEDPAEEIHKIWHSHSLWLMISAKQSCCTRLKQALGAVEIQGSALVTCLYWQAISICCHGCSKSCTCLWRIGRVNGRGVRSTCYRKGFRMFCDTVA